MALPSGKFLRVKKAFARNLWNCPGKFSDYLEGFWNVVKVSGLAGKFPNCLENFLIFWKISGWCEKFPDCLESFWIVWKVFVGSGKFPDFFVRLLGQYGVVLVDTKWYWVRKTPHWLALGDTGSVWGGTGGYLVGLGGTCDYICICMFCLYL